MTTRALSDRPGWLAALGEADQAATRVAADVYLALPDVERHAIATAVVGRLGNDWLGARHGDAETLLTTPTYAAEGSAAAGGFDPADLVGTCRWFVEQAEHVEESGFA